MLIVVLWRFAGQIVSLMDTHGGRTIHAQNVAKSFPRYISLKLLFPAPSKLTRSHYRDPLRSTHRRPAEQRDELAPLHHSITSSARASSVGGTSRPSALAVLRLMTSSYLVDTHPSGSLRSSLRLRISN